MSRFIRTILCTYIHNFLENYEVYASLKHLKTRKFHPESKILQNVEFYYTTMSIQQ